MITEELIRGVIISIFGIIVMLTSKYLTSAIRVWSPFDSKWRLKQPKTIGLWPSSKEVYGQRKASKIIFYVFGLLPLILGILLIILSILNISVLNF